MRILTPLVVAALAFCFFECSTSITISDSERRAEYHMRLADSLQAELALKAATLEYTVVADLYPQTSYYPSAVRNAAFLYSNPLNPAMNDSLSLSWFERYLGLEISKEEHAEAELCAALLRRIIQLKTENLRKAAAADSVTAVNRKQALDLTSKSRRVLDLENDLQRASQELQKLREVDLKINRRKGK